MKRINLVQGNIYRLIYPSIKSEPVPVKIINTVEAAGKCVVKGWNLQGRYRVRLVEIEWLSEYPSEEEAKIEWMSHRIQN